jgi:hypothetical protein
MAEIVTLAYAGQSGWGWNVHLARLPSGGLFVYSPAWLGDDTFAQVEKHGTPEVLFAPNNVHHLSLEKFRERWPKAIACAATPALPRLSKLGHEGLRDVAEAPLPEGAKLLVSEGTRSGETFLSLDGAFIVADAFVNFQRPISGFTGLILKQLKISGGLGIGSLFCWFSVADKAKYKSWLFEQLDREKPKRFRFSHGAPFSEPDLVDRIKSLANDRLA